MLISWNWLKTYLPLAMTPDELARRLMMAGLNHDGTLEVDGDFQINVEVTSNRPDCLGHIGVAREAAVLFNLPLSIPAATPSEAGPSVAQLAKVRVECPALCPRYTARVIRGLTVKESPSWLVKQLATINQPAINNVVDVTNFVLMECGQPLHAFDLAKLDGGEIIVRTPQKGEKIEAIDHRTYELAPEMCVIADARKAVAIGGVMGGAATEVSTATRDLLIEAADFDPVSIRSTARALNLHSASSYRFERGVDPVGVDWASRRCCELLLDLAGGELAKGVVDVGAPITPRQPITLRFAQLTRILGIAVDSDEACRILSALGCQATKTTVNETIVVPPSWRRDLSREIDLVEEVARIHGYERIPEDVPVPMIASSRTPTDRVLDRVRPVMTSGGYSEALTPSAVSEELSESFSPWTSEPPLRCRTPVLERADCLRRSLIPSLLESRRTNESLGNERIELFEIARVYFSHPATPPSEELLVALTSGRSFAAVKGAIEALVASLSPSSAVASEEFSNELFTEASCRLLLDGKPWGWLGELSAAGRAKFDLRGPATVAEFSFAPLLAIARLVPKYAPQSDYPAIDRDLNLVVAEATRWADVAATARAAAGEQLESLRYVETYRNAKDPQLGHGRKSLLLTLRWRSATGTLTGQEVDGLREKIVTACKEAHQAELRA